MSGGATEDVGLLRSEPVQTDELVCSPPTVEVGICFLILYVDVCFLFNPLIIFMSSR